MKTIKSKYRSKPSYILLTKEEYSLMLELKEITKIDLSGDSYDSYFQRYRITIE